MILHYFKKKENTEEIIANKLYKDILYKSNKLLKDNGFFKNKNYNTSFEIVSFFLIIHIKLNIEYNVKNYKIINESLIKIFISDLDESLRTLGIGDMSIGKYVKSYVKKFYYRLSKFPKKISNISYDNLDDYLTNFSYIISTKKNDAVLVFFNTYKKILVSYK